MLGFIAPIPAPNRSPIRNPIPKPLKPPSPFGGVLKNLGATLLFELLFPPPTAKSALDEIDPALLYPPNDEVIEETTTPSRTQLGYGDVPGVKYEILWEYDNDINDSTPPVRQWFEVWHAYRGPIQIVNIFLSAQTGTSSDNKNGFPEVKGIGRSGKWYLQGWAHDFSGNQIEFQQVAPGSTGIYKVGRGTFLDLRPVGGQPEPPTINKVYSQRSPNSSNGSPNKPITNLGTDPFLNPVPTPPDLPLPFPNPIPYPDIPDDTDRINDVNRDNGLDPSNSVTRNYTRSYDPTRDDPNTTTTTNYLPVPSVPRPAPGVGGSPVQVNDGSLTPNNFVENPPSEVEQTPSPNIAPFDLNLIPGILFAPNNLDKLKRNTQDAICESSENGCLLNNVTNPILNNQNNNANVLLNAYNALGQTIDLSLLNVINNKLGEQLPGGISGYFKKAWDFTKMDKVLNVLNLAVNLHNASMLSRNIGETLGEAVSNALSFIGIKDAEGNTIDINELISQGVTNLITSIIGTENYEALLTKWAKANRIYQTGMNLLGNLRGILGSMEEIAEETGVDVARIGNALRDSGTVEADSYPHMAENKRGLIKIFDALEKAEDTADVVLNITEEIKSIGEEAQEFQENRQTIREAFRQEKEEIDRIEKVADRRIENLPEPTEEDKLETVE